MCRAECNSDRSALRSKNEWKAKQPTDSWQPDGNASNNNNRNNKVSTQKQKLTFYVWGNNPSTIQKTQTNVSSPEWELHFLKFNRVGSERFKSSDDSWHQQLQKQQCVQLSFFFIPTSVKIVISTSPYGFCWKVYFHSGLFRKTFPHAIT